MWSLFLFLRLLFSIGIADVNTEERNVKEIQDKIKSMNILKGREEGGKGDGRYIVKASIARTMESERERGNMVKSIKREKEELEKEKSTLQKSLNKMDKQGENIGGL